MVLLLPPAKGVLDTTATSLRSAAHSYITFTSLIFIIETYDERKEISTKKCNIILYGLEESTNPHQEIKEIVELNKALGNSEFTKYNIKRLGRIGDKHGARPLKIELDSHVTKLNIMRKTNLLPNIEKYKHLSIQHDLTKRQHHQLCQLKEESRNLETNDTRGNVKYRVRGPPGKWEIVTFPKN